MRGSPNRSPPRGIRLRNGNVLLLCLPQLPADLVPKITQRLPNGNTLICEGDFGRLFAVTADGKLVWDFVNPYFGEGPTGQHNRVFRAHRYSKEEIAKAKATGGG